MSNQNDITIHFTKNTLSGTQYTADDWLAGAIPFKQIAEERGITKEQAMELITDWGLISREQALKIQVIKGKSYGLAIDQTVTTIMQEEMDKIDSATHPEQYVKKFISSSQKILDLHPELMESIYLTGGYNASNYHGIMPETVHRVNENEKAGRVEIMDVWDWDYGPGEPVFNESYELAVKFQVIQKLESWLVNPDEYTKPSPAPSKGPGRGPDFPDQRKFVKSYWSDSEKREELWDKCGNPHAISKAIFEILKSKIADHPDQFSNHSPAHPSTIRDWIGLKN